MEEDLNMQGWAEEEIRNRDLMVPCGLHRGACGVYIATRDGNEKFKGIMANLYGTKPEETECLGCMQPDPPKKAVPLVRRMPDKALREIKGVLLLPSVPGMAVQPGSGFPVCHWPPGHEKNDSHMAGEGSRLR